MKNIILKIYTYQKKNNDILINMYNECSIKTGKIPSFLLDQIEIKRKYIEKYY